MFCLLWTIYHLSKLSTFNLSEVSPGIINRDIGYCYLSLALFVPAFLWLWPWPHSFHAVAFGFDTVKVRYLSWSIDIESDLLQTFLVKHVYSFGICGALLSGSIQWNNLELFVGEPRECGRAQWIICRGWNPLH